MPSLISEIKFDKASQEELLEGVHILAKAVSSTLGPLGRNVAIAHANQYGDIYERITLHDGVRVAKSIYLENEFQNMGAQLLKQAAQKQVQDVGDGTTVSVILAEALFDGFTTLTATGVNPMLLRRGLEKGIETLVSEIESIALPIKGYSHMKQIATISAEDEVLGELVAKVVDDMGKDGLIYPEESPKGMTEVEKQEGMQIDSGYAHSFFITDPTRNQSTMERPLILVTDKTINTLVPLKHILEYAASNGRHLVFITPQIGQDALGALIKNKMDGVIYSLGINAPLFGSHQKNMLIDIAVFTGGKFITEDAGDSFENVTIEDLGRADYVTATKLSSLIVGGKGEKKTIDARIESIKGSIEREESDFDREKMKERLGRLTTGVAVIKVGGATEVEMKERLERVKDAVSATQAALKSGIVPGGETIYLHIREKLKSPIEDEYERMAYDLLYKALYRPFEILLTNAGMNHGEWYEKLKQAKMLKGVDVTKNSLVDLVKVGIVDPAAVPMNALQNAASVAIQLAIANTTIIQKIPKLDK